MEFDDLRSEPLSGSLMVPRKATNLAHCFVYPRALNGLNELGALLGNRVGKKYDAGLEMPKEQSSEMLWENLV